MDQRHLWREDTAHATATPTQQRLAREHVERMRRWGQLSTPKLEPRKLPPLPAAKAPALMAEQGTPDWVSIWLNQWRAKLARMLSHRLIQTVVAERYGTTRLKLVGRERLGKLVLARHIAMWLCLDMIKGASLPTVGKAFGNRDHTTVLHGRNRIRKKITQSVVFAAELEDLKRQILAAVE